MSEQAIFDSLRQELDRLQADKTIPEKAIIVDAASRQRIETAIGHNVSTPEELATRIERAFTVEVSDVSVPLTPYLLARLQSRAIRVDFKDFMKLTVKRLLEEYAGLR